MPKKPSRLEVWENSIKDNPDYWTACKRTGPGRFNTRKATSLEQAIRFARKMGGHVMVYAVKGVHSTIVTTINNDKLKD